MRRLFKIAEEYTKTPGGRTPADGPYSGEDFREKHLKPMFVEAKSSGGGLAIDFDGGYGYSPSFLEESFGGLVRELKDESIADIELISKEEPGLIDKINIILEKAFGDL